MLFYLWISFLDFNLLEWNFWTFGRGFLSNRKCKSSSLLTYFYCYRNQRGSSRWSRRHWRHGWYGRHGRYGRNGRHDVKCRHPPPPRPPNSIFWAREPPISFSAINFIQEDAIEIKQLINQVKQTKCVIWYVPPLRLPPNKMHFFVSNELKFVLSSKHEGDLKIHAVATT